MNFITDPPGKVIRLKLSRDRRRAIKQGHPWIYRDCFESLPKARPGSRAMVRDKDGSLIAFGMYDPESPLSVRVCAIEDEQLDDALILKRLEDARKLRCQLFDKNTNGYRLINGEGDRLPGLVCDVYDRVAVIRLDGNGPSGFWDTGGIAQWLHEAFAIQAVYVKNRSDAAERGQCIFGALESTQIPFLENGVHFSADIALGQKTGFFFDQRDNRQRIRGLAKGKRVLNLFGYTGGFSVYAGCAGACEVTTVDLAKPAIEDAHANWLANNLDPHLHHGIASDCFQFLKEAVARKEEWDLIVVDPPSFAHADKMVDRAKESYENLFALALGVLAPGGIIAFSSCSSHISPALFLEMSQAAVSQAKRRASVLGIYGQPEDHPFPLACQELQYLKFVLLQAL